MEEEAMDAIKSATSNIDTKNLEKILADKTPEFCGWALYFAVQQGVDDNKNKLIQKSSSYDFNSELTIRAIEYKNKQLVKIFLHYGANVNLIIDNSLGLTVFAYACRYASADIVEALIESGANLNIKDKTGHFPIRIAFQSFRKDKIDLFLDRVNATRNNVNEWHLLNLYVEYASPREDDIARLLKIGADLNGIDEEGHTVLNSSVLSRNLKILKFLIKNGADVNGINGEGDSELTFAVKNGKIECIKILLESGSDTNLGDRFPLIEASRGLRQDCLEVINLLLNFGADINKRRYDQTPIVFAAREGCVKTIQLLLKRGAKRDISALFEAIALGNSVVVKLLIDQGFNVNRLRLGKTALFWAIQYEKTEIVKLLLDHGARVDQLLTDCLWRCALHYSVENGNREIVELLLDRGADLNLEDKGKNALTISIAKGHVETCKFLLRRIIFMKTQNLYVSKMNLNSTCTKKELYAFQRECIKEMERLKAKRFDDSSLSYYDILNIDNVKKLASLACNENIVKVITCKASKKQFPIYWSMFVQHFNRGILRNKDFELVKRFIDYLSTRKRDQFPQLPFALICEIFTYLKDEDVANLRKL